VSLDRRHSLVAARVDDVGRAVLACQALPRLVPARGDDPLRAELLGGEHGEQTDRAVAGNSARISSSASSSSGACTVRGVRSTGSTEAPDFVVLFLAGEG
jgi:hypothetical protein